MRTLRRLIGNLATRTESYQQAGTFSPSSGLSSSTVFRVCYSCYYTIIHGLFLKNFNISINKERLRTTREVGYLRIYCHVDLDRFCWSNIYLKSNVLNSCLILLNIWEFYKNSLSSHLSMGLYRKLLCISVGNRYILSLRFSVSKHFSPKESFVYESQETQ